MKLSDMRKIAEARTRGVKYTHEFNTMVSKNIVKLLDVAEAAKPLMGLTAYMDVEMQMKLGEALNQLESEE